MTIDARGRSSDHDHVGSSYDDAGAIACIVIGSIIVTIVAVRFVVRRRSK